MKRVCAIVGTGEKGKRWSPVVAEAAEWVGGAAAEVGWAVLTGGLTGVMEAAARGAQQAGGLTIGLLPGLLHGEANSALDVVLPTGLGIARNVLVASGCHAMIALPGGTGTLQEMTFALDYGRAVFSWGSWELPGILVCPLENRASVRRWLETEMRRLQ